MATSSVPSLSKLVYETQIVSIRGVDGPIDWTLGTYTCSSVYLNQSNRVIGL